MSLDKEVLDVVEITRRYVLAKEKERQQKRALRIIQNKSMQSLQQPSRQLPEKKAVRFDGIAIQTTIQNPIEIPIQNNIKKPINITVMYQPADKPNKTIDTPEDIIYRELEEQFKEESAST